MEKSLTPTRTIDCSLPGVDAATAFEMFGTDSLLNVARKLARAELEPNNPDYEVSDRELVRVLALQVNLPPPIRRRLISISTGVPRPAGRRSSGVSELIRNQCALFFFEDLKQTLTDEHRAKTREQRRGCAPPGDAALQITKETYFPELSKRGVQNRLTRIRRRFL